MSALYIRQRLWIGKRCKIAFFHVLFVFNKKKTNSFFILLTHAGSHREVYQEFQPRYDILRWSGAKSCSDHRFRAPPACTAQSPTLHQHINH